MTDGLLTTPMAAFLEPDCLTLILSAEIQIKRTLNQRMLAIHGVTLSQGRALFHLARCRTMSCQSLAALLGCSISRISRLTHYLESRSLIVRDRNGEDRRELRLSLTKLGHAIAQQVPATLREGEDAILAQLPGEERKDLKQLLHRMLKQFDRDSQPHI